MRLVKHRQTPCIFFIYGHDNAMYDFFSTVVDQYTNASVTSLKKNSTLGLRSLRQRVSKFLRSSQFCVALASADDRVKEEFRCRQNVILELGSASQLLGEDRCVVILDPIVTLPSDLSDITYIPYDSSNRKEALIQFLAQLKSWGIDYDPNVLNMV